ncbi:MAG: hypothetical protein Q8P74_02120 [bacterium]|nr:hypothetical protein [bacterium]
MNKSYQLVELQKLLVSAQNIFVAMPQGANFDQIAAGLSLQLALSKSGKAVSVLSPDAMTVEYSHLVGVEKISDKASGGDLQMTIDVPIGNIEKVTSKDEDGRLNLIIRAKSGIAPITKEEILFSSAGGPADLVFVIEAKRLDSLGKIYKENEASFSEKPVVHISHYPRAESFGTVNVIDPAASSASEIVVALIQGLNLALDEDSAGNLLAGLRTATSNFQSSATNADTFEAASICLRHAGVHLSAPQPQMPEENLEKEQPDVSPDWFEPKIYKGSTLP